MPAVSKAQQKLMGMVHSYKKGEMKDAPESVKKIAKSMTDEEAEKFAKTKHKGLPGHVTETITFRQYLELCETQSNGLSKAEKEYLDASEKVKQAKQSGDKQKIAVAQKKAQEAADTLELIVASMRT